MTEKIFSLDIGTRTVIGLILEKKDANYELIDYYVEEHQERAMLDGQIHDVVAVAETIEKVKLHLENSHGPLKSVCVAAAGRALKTKRTQVSKEIDQQPLMSKEDILFLELSAVQKAQYALANEALEDTSTEYYCVGYSVIRYQLDAQTIGSLIDQQGKTASVEIIATFLPKVVVESLISSLTRAGLEMQALTLEPIAAIDVLIPASMRKLNVALVDIGAGTSDIALTDDGTVSAYGMVPKAGDEITEALSEHFLLDFPQAEQMKRELSSQQEVTITDILGFEQTITYEEAVTAISEDIDALAEAIQAEILTLNNCAPKAVMLVGGGSLTPEITSRLASKLELPGNRVAIRGSEAIPALTKTDRLPGGPAYVTPIGIAIAAKQNPVHYISVTVNERAVRLFDMKQLTAADCLLAAGINVDKLYGLPGMAAIVSVNGKEVTIPGSYGTPPTLWLNDEAAQIDEAIKQGDKLVVEKGNDGSPPDITVAELLGDIPKTSISLNGTEIEMETKILVNDMEAGPDTKLEDRDNIRVETVKTVRDLLIYAGREEWLEGTEDFTVFVNGNQLLLDNIPAYLQKNNQQAKLEDKIKNGDSITYTSSQNPTVNHILEKMQLQMKYHLPITFNEEKLVLEKPAVKVTRNSRQLTEEDTINPGDHLSIEKIPHSPFIFQDIFRFATVNLSEATGNFHIYKNGEPAAFFDELAPHDELVLHFQ
ncbi:cell division protein FtsA [Sediminibacillus halophilus]|uniref:Cell division protein FtsA n=1 Tax=Sediminibacillus halophilus TaxID=482461 RepID=A0A1G9Y4B2_9BACI|nr:cell division FtsA domain-containing protein [Sediminibacillus halophilus]SDN03919.1 cell division protein FtsA [Sediminibacillus halophilus]